MSSKLEQIRQYHSCIEGYVDYCKKTQRRDYDAERYLEDIGYLLEYIDGSISAEKETVELQSPLRSFDTTMFIIDTSPGIDIEGLMHVWEEVFGEQTNEMPKYCHKRKRSIDAKNGRWNFDVEL
jgi:hypothetical protein